MEKIIDSTLEKYRDTNLHSAAGRQAIVKAIMKKIRKNDTGWYLNFNTIDGKVPEVGDEKEKQKWVCKICGQSTFEVEYDYIGTETNHLECELQLESI